MVKEIYVYAERLIGLPVARAAPGFTTFGSYLVLFGGHTADYQDLSDMRFFDLTSFSWLPTPSAGLEGREPSERSYASLAVVPAPYTPPLLGAMVVGLITGDSGKAAMQPFSGDLFKGMLSFFLLDMGLMAARNLPQLKDKSTVLLTYAVGAPIVHASLALGLAWTFSLPLGEGALLMVLAASASYIAVPAVLRYSLPEANPSLYFGLSLGVTFPLNILLGIPVYTAIAQVVLV